MHDPAVYGDRQVFKPRDRDAVVLDGDAVREIEKRAKEALADRGTADQFLLEMIQMMCVKVLSSPNGVKGVNIQELFRLWKEVTEGPGDTGSRDHRNRDTIDNPLTGCTEEEGYTDEE